MPDIPDIETAIAHLYEAIAQNTLLLEQQTPDTWHYLLTQNRMLRDEIRELEDRRAFGGTDAPCPH